jgi:hypothetical protein
MIRVTGQYPIVEGTIEDFDHLIDALMNVLMLDPTITDPDLALDLEHGIFQTEFVVDTDDVFEASQIGSHAMSVAFAATGINGPDTTVHYAHKDLVGRAPTNLELALVGV